MPRPPRTALLGTLALLACGDPEPVDTGPAGSDGSADEPEGAWETQEPAPAPEWTADQAAERIHAALALGLPSPDGALALYLDLMSRGDAGCPGDTQQLDPAFVGLEGCDASTGYRYAGASLYDDYGDGWVLSADLEITDPDGATFSAGGTANGWSPGDIDESSEEFTGTWIYPASDDPWMAAGVSAYFTRMQILDAGAPVVTIDGGVDIGGTALAMEALTWRDDCGPEGSIALHQPGDGWYRAELVCGCGALDFEGEPLGEICLDLPEAP